MKEFIIYGEEHHADLPLLLSENNLGLVHSTFQNGVNVKMGESLVFIGDTKNGCLPFGIHLKQDVLHKFLSCIRNDLIVFWKGFSLFFTNEEILMKLDLHLSTPYWNAIPKIKKEKINFTSFDQFLALYMANREPIGIDDLFVDQFLLYYLDNAEIEQMELAIKISDLMDAVFSDDKVVIEQLLRYFLGRGRGLTPTGDDILVGLLAVHAATGMYSHTFIHVLKEIIQTESITTDVSKEYLIYALNGKFSSVVTQLMTDLLEQESVDLNQHFTNLIQVGHSSGVDAAFGIVIGMLTIRRKK